MSETADVQMGFGRRGSDSSPYPCVDPNIFAGQRCKQVSNNADDAYYISDDTWEGLKFP